MDRLKMDQNTQKYYSNLWSTDGELRYAAFLLLIEATNQPVDWADEVWGDLVKKLDHPDNHFRAIAGQLLANLSKSDKKNRMLEDFPKLLAVTRDTRFVTARHCLQAIWKVGAVGEPQLKLVLEGLSLRFRECVEEKHFTLIRSDIIAALKQLYQKIGSEDVAMIAFELIETVEDEKYRKKYAVLWRNK